MDTYLLVHRHRHGYRGTPETAAAWKDWFTQLGDALVDPGNAVLDGRGAAGDAGSSLPLGGYTIVQAASLEEAVRLASGCPIIEAGGAVEVGELTLLDESQAPTQPIILAVTVDAGPDRVFRILSSSQGQRAFWTADCDITGAHARFGFPGASADVEADVVREPNRLVRMRVTAGPRTSFLENSTFEWELNGTERDTRTDVVFRHYGFAGYVRGGEWHGERSPEFDFGEMAETWALLLDRLRSYISTGIPNPYFPASAG